MSDVNVEWWSVVEKLSTIEECCPQPAINFLPEWFKKTPPFPDETHYVKGADIAINPDGTPHRGTVKKCPGMVELFQQGYILPMWCDTYLQCDGDNWNWRTPWADMECSIHKPNQFLDYAPNWVRDEVSVVFKMNSPWRVRTPPGYSIYQLPLFYNFNKDYTVPMGVQRADIYHETNIVVLFHSKEQEIVIKRGTPLVWFVPFKREEYNYTVSEETEEYRDIRMRSDKMIQTKFTGGYKTERRGT